MRRLPLVGGTLVVLALLVAGLWFRGTPAREPAVAPARNAEPVVAPAPLPAPTPTEPSPRLAGRLEFGADGAFVATPAALAWIDSFLFAHRHLPDELRRARLEEALRAALPPSAHAGALDLARRNLAFREAARGAFAEGQSAGDLDRHLQWLRELRRRTYGAELAEALFADEEATLRVQLEMRRAAERLADDPEAREAALAALAEEWPDEVRERHARTTAPLRLARDTAALREAGASDAEIFALRAERVGPEAAERMAALDAERAAFADRLARYREERAAEIARGASAADLEALRAEIFPPAERDHVARLDAIDAQREARSAVVEAHEDAPNPPGAETTTPP